MKTDTSERGLEDLILIDMAGRARWDGPEAGRLGEAAETYGTGWILGDAHDYVRDACVDLVQLRAFLQATQPEIAQALHLDSDTPVRRKFLDRLQSEVAKKGVIHLLLVLSDKIRTG